MTIRSFIIIMRRLRIGLIVLVLVGCAEPTRTPGTIAGGQLPRATTASGSANTTVAAASTTSGTNAVATTAATRAGQTAPPATTATSLTTIALSAPPTTAPSPTIAPTSTPVPLVFQNAVPLPDIDMSGAIAGRVPAEQRNAMIQSAKGDIDALAATTPVYSISVQPDLTSFAYTGHETVSYVNTTGAILNDCMLRLYPNVYDKTGGSLAIASFAIDGQQIGGPFQAGDDDSYLSVPLATALQPNVAATIEIVFNGTIPRGFDAQNSGEFTFENGALNMAQFYPQIGVWENGGWSKEKISYTTDLTYAETAFYTVNVIAPQSHKVFGTGVNRVVGTAGDKNITRFVSGPVREFAFFSGPTYTAISAAAGDVAVNLIYETRSGNSDNLRREAERNLRIATTSVSTYSARYGQYPYTKMDIIFTPTRSGGLEWPSIVQVGQQMLATPSHGYLPQNLPNVLPEYGDDASFTVAHEIGHQWWYALVGDDQQKNAWVDEGLTNYTSYFLPGLAKIGSDAAAVSSWESWMSSYLSKAVKDRVARIGDVVVNQPATGFATVQADSSKIDLAAYQKPPLFYDTFRRSYGDDAFLTFARTLFSTYKYKIVRPDNIRTTLQAAAPGKEADVAALYQRWIIETHVKEDVK